MLMVIEVGALTSYFLTALLQIFNLTSRLYIPLENASTGGCRTVGKKLLTQKALDNTGCCRGLSSYLANVKLSAMSPLEPLLCLW